MAKKRVVIVDDHEVVRIGLRALLAQHPQFEIIDEAVKNIPNTITLQYPDIQRRDIVDFRNLLIHQYCGVDLEIVWKTIHEDLPALKNAIHNIEKNL